MSSPFATFRKNQTYWMAGLVLLAILAFIVAPALQIAGGMRPTQGDRVIVRWKGGRMTEAELERARQQHYRFIRFLSVLSKEVLAAGGQPEVYSFYVEGKNIRDLGVNSQSDNLSIIETRLFAAYAKSNGIEFDDDAANQFLLAFCNNRIPTARLAEILAETSDKQLTVFDLREMIKLEMAANVAKQMALRGWTREFKPDAISLVQMTQTPGDMWNDFLKLKQTARVEAYPVLVSDFVKSVTGEPTEAEILEIYEAGKGRLAEPFLPDPGFMRPYRANFEFVEGGFTAWVDREKAKLSEEQLRTEYDRMVSLGQLKTNAPLTPPADPQAPVTPGPSVPTDKPADPATKPADPTTKPADPTTPAPATSPEPTTPEPKSETPATEKLELTPDAPAKPASDAQPAEGSPVPDKKDQSANLSPAVRLVSFQDEPKETGNQELPPVVVQPNAPGENTSTTSSGAASTNTAGASDGNAAIAVAMRTKTFEEAKDEVARSLAQGAAMESLQKALTGMNESMTKYSAAYRQHAVSEKAGFKTEVKVTRPSLKKLSQELGLTYGETGVVDRSKFAQTDLGRSFVDLQSQGLGQMPVARFGMSPSFDLYTPASSFFFNQMAATPDIRQYIFWKTDEQQASIPELGEVREEVIAAWKTKKARLLAQSEAEKISKKIITGDDAWKDAITAEQKALVVSTDPFTWLSGLGESPQISNIPTLNDVGQEFMQKVFGVGEGKAGVAPNQGQNVYYVFRVVDVTPAIAELREQFSSDPAKFAVRRVGQVEGQRLYEGWYESIDERLQVKWEINVSELTGE